MSATCKIIERHQLEKYYILECEKPPLTKIKVKVCLQNENEAKILAEEEVEKLTSAPQNNYIEIGCK